MSTHDPLGELRLAYLESLASQIELLEFQKSSPRLDSGLLQRLAHRLRGSGATYGFPAVSHAAAHLEDAPEGEHRERVDALLKVLRETVRARVSCAVPVLVVEDDPNLTRLLEECLGFSDRRVVSVPSGRAARRFLSQETPGLIILDLVLPDEDGRNILSWLRGRVQTEHVPVLVLSVVGSLAARTECLALGATTFLRKPFDAETLRATVSAALRQAAQAVSSPQLDELTTLLVRTAFIQVFEQYRSVARQADWSASIALLDLDHLSRINREHGREFGDQCLVHWARALASALATTDVVARWGGEEVAVLAPGRSQRELKADLLEVQRAMTAAPLQAPGGAPVKLTFSGGVADVPALADPEAAVARADWFLFQAKAAGRDRIVSASEHVVRVPTRILVVEDDEDMTAILTKGLEDEGYEVTSRSDGDQAFSTAFHSDFDVAVIDIVVPGMDGKELLQGLRKNSRTARLPIVMVTAIGSERDILECFNLGADDYIVKPVSMPQLLARLRRLLKRTAAKG